MSILVVLLKDVPNLGKIGETVRVKPGYARNYLLPQKLAVLAGSSEAKEMLKKAKEKKEEKERQIEVKKEKKLEQEEKQQVMKARKEALLKKKWYNKDKRSR